MKKLARITALVLVLVWVMGVIASGSATTEPIKIGYIGCISGNDAYLGQTAILALKDWVQEVNNAGGILGRQVELISYDIGLDPTAETVNATNRLIELDNVVAIIGPESSDQAIAAVDIVNTAKVPMITTTASNETVTVSEDGTLHDYMYRMCFIDSYQGTALADYTYNQLGITKVAVLGDIANLYTQGIQDYFVAEFKKIGGEITSVEGFVDTDTEFRAPLTNIKNSDAEAILIATGTYKVAGMIGKQCKDLGMTQQILGVDGWYAQELITFAGTELNGALMASMMDDQAEEFTAYRTQFAARHNNQSVNYFAYYALDAAMLIKWAIEDAQSADPTVFKTSIDNAKDVPVFTCDLTIDPLTHNPVNKPIYILEVTPESFVTKEKFTPGK